MASALTRAPVVQDAVRGCGWHRWHHASVPWAPAGQPSSSGARPPARPSRRTASRRGAARSRQNHLHGLQHAGQLRHLAAQRVHLVLNRRVGVRLLLLALGPLLGAARRRPPQSGVHGVASECRGAVVSRGSGEGTSQTTAVADDSCLHMHALRGHALRATLVARIRRFPQVLLLDVLAPAWEVGQERGVRQLRLGVGHSKDHRPARQSNGQAAATISASHGAAQSSSCFQQTY